MTQQFYTSGVPLFKATGVPAMDANCCCEDGCWYCTKPRGISIVNDADPLGDDGCFCDSVNGTYLVGSATYDGLTLPAGDPACTALWRYEFTCNCEYDVGPGNYVINRLRWDLSLNVSQPGGNARVEITVRLSHARHRIIDLGAGTGDPCLKAWDFFPPLPASGDQTIDGWSITAANVKWHTRIASFARNYTSPACPADEDVIIGGSTSESGNDASLAICNYASIVAKILM